MSHIVEIRTEVRDANAIAAACQRLSLDKPTVGTVNLFSGKAGGWIVRLPGWQFPVVFDVDQGQVRFDDYGGRWGDRVKLDAFLQAYAVEKAKFEARKQGHSVLEQPLEDGSIKLTIGLGEAA